jgi:SH3-like domain-containing protein
MSPKCLAACALLTGLGWLTGCHSPIIDTSQPSAVAYVAPGTLNLRPSLGQKDTVIGVLHHGERVQVLEARRRFVRIRTANGAAGWVDALQLLTPERMAQLQAEAKRAAALPSEGAATAFEDLNVHLEPNRQSPAFARIPEGGAAQVLEHRVSARTSTAPKVPVFDIPKPLTARKERRLNESRTAFPLPRPKPPKPPADALTGSAPPPKPAPTVPEAPVVLEDWSLVRMKDGQTGWVITRNLMMSIPDEVAQYAEGKHITSYFDLGPVNDDEKGLKHNWLWTTTSEIEPADFDGWRVFIWNRRHHRYETSFRARDLEGRFPVTVDPAGTDSPMRTFHLIFKEGDGQFWTHAYTFDGVLVHSASKEPYGLSQSASQQANGAAAGAAAKRPGWFASHWDALLQKFRKK